MQIVWEGIAAAREAAKFNKMSSNLCPFHSLPFFLRLPLDSIDFFIPPREIFSRTTTSQRQKATINSQFHIIFLLFYLKKISILLISGV